MKPWMMKLSVFAALLLIIWILLAPGCMTFRKPDTKWVKKFSDQQIELKTNTIKVLDHSLHYVQTGSDSLPTLVFIHGSPGSWDAFSSYLMHKPLLAKYRMVSIDRPGFGYSEFGNAQHLAEQSQIIGALLKQLQNRQPIMVAGHSLGGPLAIQLAADFPETIQKLVLIAGSIDPAEEKPEKWRPVLMYTPLQLLIPGAMKPSNKELWYLKKDLYDLQQEFSKVKCPVVFIHGSKDSWVPIENIRYGAKMLVNSSRIDSLVFKEGNHFIPWTKMDSIQQFLLEMR